MKKYLIYFKTSFVLLSILSLLVCSCKDETEYDFNGDPVNKVFLNIPSNTVNGSGKMNFSLIQTPLVTAGDVKCSFPVYSSLSAEADIKVSLSVDTTLVSLFNKTNGTTHIAIPDNIIDLGNNQLTIPAGASLSKDSIKIQISAENKKKLTAKSYLIPLKINSIDGNNAAISSNRNVIYLVVSTSTDVDNIWDGAGSSSLKGTQASDRTGWTATSSSATFYSQTGSPSMIFDGVVSTASRWSVSYKDPTSVTIDLGKTYNNIEALYGYSSIAKGMFIQSSVDGTTWVDAGTTTASSSYVVFYSPLSARYIKMNLPLSGLYYSLSLYEFNIYLK